jgi:spore germination cell wall hydrolase CwlJ-like protein
MCFGSQSFPSILVPPAFAGDNYSGDADKNAGSSPGNRDMDRSYGYRNYAPDPKTEPYEVGILARIIFAEAGSGAGGPEAVGWAVRNRVDADVGAGFDDDATYQDAILRRGQFAAVGGDRWRKFADPGSLDPGELAMYNKALTAARQVYSGQIPDPTGGATFFRSHGKGERVPDGFQELGGNIFR